MLGDLKYEKNKETHTFDFQTSRAGNQSSPGERAGAVS